MLNWYFVTSDVYKAAVAANTVTNDMLCFLSDTGELYRGTQMFNESVELYTTLPTTGVAMGKLYINSTNLEGRVWNGTSWTTVIKPVATTVSASNTTQGVTGKAVVDYVATQIEELANSSDVVTDVTYTADTNTLNVTTGDGTTQNLAMSNVAASMKYDPATGKLTLLNAQGTALGTAVNLDLERFVSSASYDADTKTIVLNFNDKSDALNINVGDLVDTYTAASGKGVKLTVTGNKFTAEAIVSATAGNKLTLTDNGLYVAATDISGKVDKVSNATAGNVATLTAAGGIQDSGVAAGGAAMAATTNDKTLATEKAVETYVSGVREALSDSIAKKMAKVGTGKTGQVIRATATGDAEASGYTIGGDTMNGGSKVLATEKGAQAYVQGYAVAKTNVVGSAEFAAQADAASDSKVTSEKAVVDALTWKTSF